MKTVSIESAQHNGKINLLQYSHGTADRHVHNDIFISICELTTFALTDDMVMADNNSSTRTKLSTHTHTHTLEHGAHEL